MANKNDTDLISVMLKLPAMLHAEYFVRASPHIIDDANYWNILGTLWKAGGTVIQQEQWLKLFTSPRPKAHKIMKSRERRAWRKLPAKVVAYRAVNNRGEAFIAMSWTLDLKTAERFSEAGTRKIVKRTFDKKDIFAYFDRRGESEIIILTL